MGVPVHVWTPPEIQSTVGKAVMVPKLIGPRETADPILEQLLAATPKDRGRSTELISAEDVKQSAQQTSEHGIALVSYDEDDESDLALMTAARHQNLDFVLRGQIVPDRRPRPIREAGNRLTISWSLVPLNRSENPATSQSQPGRPVIVDFESAIKKYPDLSLAENKDAALRAAMVRETLPLFTPSVQRDRVQLEIPYITPGSKLIRKGNALAHAGRWAEAESTWKEVAEKYRFSSVAVHNLAIAAVAKQDFSAARELARKAVRMKPNSLHQQTLVWVEKTQRMYHEAFQLSDPPEGWFVTRR